MSIDNIYFYSQDAVEYHKKVLITPFDGSEANRFAKSSAANYLRNWSLKLAAFANLSDTDASKYCKNEVQRLQLIIKIAQDQDGIKW